MLHDRHVIVTCVLVDAACGFGELGAVYHVDVPIVVFVAKDHDRAKAEHIIMHFLDARRLR